VLARFRRVPAQLHLINRPIQGVELMLEQGGLHVLLGMDVFFYRVS
jgi:hypothetical protein